MESVRCIQKKAGIGRTLVTSTFWYEILEIPRICPHMPPHLLYQYSFIWRKCSTVSAKTATAPYVWGTRAALTAQVARVHTDQAEAADAVHARVAQAAHTDRARTTRIAHAAQSERLIPHSRRAWCRSKKQPTPL